MNKECGWRGSEFNSDSGAEFTFAYLHALVAVNLGGFFASAEGLTRGTLAAGIAKHVRWGRHGGMLRMISHAAVTLPLISPRCKADRARRFLAGLGEGGREGGYS